MSETNMLPKVSCLLVTANRPRLCQRAIWSFQQQTYANKVLVVLDNGAAPIEHLLAEVPAAQVAYHYVAPTENQVIGTLRNEALALAEGTYIVPQWDDDDWSHPDRLATQVAVLEQGYDACALPATLMHIANPAYFHHPFVGNLRHGVPPTIMHRRDADIRYPPLRRASDTPYLEAWRQRRYHVLPQETAHLYLRYFHGENLWEEAHFLRRLRNSPRDFLIYAWHTFVRRNFFGHPRFQLSPQAAASFKRYLADSNRFGLFEPSLLAATAAASPILV